MFNSCGRYFAGSLLEMSRECVAREAFSKHFFGLCRKLWRMCMLDFLAIFSEGALDTVSLIIRGSSSKGGASRTWDFEGYLMLEYVPILSSHGIGRYCLRVSV